MSGGSDQRQSLHGTAVALGLNAVLLRGVPGAGKSDLALRCLAVHAPGLLDGPVRLVGDDRVFVEAVDGALLVRAAPQIYGKLEVRGAGIVPVPAIACARLVLVADLVSPDQTIERHPEADQQIFDGLAVASIRIRPFEASAAVKLLIALATHAKALNGA